MNRLFFCFALTALLAACVSQPTVVAQVSPTTPISPTSPISPAQLSANMAALLPADVLLLGEQHDAAEHQQIHTQVIALLAQRGTLAAVALEMADAGASTASLQPNATEAQTQSALKWNNNAWPWAAYGPAVMAAVRAGVPVLGANLSREQMRPKMLDATLDGQLPGPALKAQQQLIRSGHCNLLPESQITPMTRIQIAKDISMANTLANAVLPGKVTVLLSGSGHTDRLLGVPQHLPASLKVKAVRLRAGDAAADDKPEAFDAVWATPALPEKDYCAEFKKQMGMK